MLIDIPNSEVDDEVLRDENEDDEDRELLPVPIEVGEEVAVALLLSNPPNTPPKSAVPTLGPL